MKKMFSLLGLILFTGLIFIGCSKDEDEPVLPVIAFEQKPGLVTGDITAAYGDTLYFGIILQGNGTDNLIKFEIKANGSLMHESTLNTQNHTFSFYTIKGPNPEDVWSFSTTDAAGNRKEETITITGSFGPILSYTAILMGAQSNATTESFLSLQDNKTTLYFQAEAFQNQSKIDMLCYFEGGQMFLASPGGNIAGIFTGATSPENYSTKNLTQFVKTTLSAADFDNANTDALLYYGYSLAQPSIKAGGLLKDDVYAFLTHNGFTGLFKVLEVNGNASGTLKIDIKIQKELSVGKSLEIHAY
ncbi:MAG: hypothetical protein RBR28_09005 [Lentimicrobium sp.]|jgi:hypothetical protein|nr:hypothetical protein [Lentimicrobium sp.]